MYSSTTKSLSLRDVQTKIRYTCEYQLKFKQSTKEINKLINVCQEVNFNLCTLDVQQQLTLPLGYLQSKKECTRKLTPKN